MRGLAYYWLLIAAAAACGQGQPPTPILSGFVTRVASGADFDVNATRILCGPDTQIASPNRDSYIPGCPEQPPVLGQEVNVYGHRRTKQNAIVAERLEFKPVSRGEISGSAVVDAVLQADASGQGTIEIRADGYRIAITPRTEVEFVAPLRTPADIMTNVWVDYDAKAGSHGVFEAHDAKFRQNLISRSQDGRRAKTEYDPATVPANAKQNGISATVSGPDPKQMAPWPDTAMQERVQTIGNKLVPAWEHNLADADPTRIRFRFEVTTGDGWRRVIALPSGVILVPHWIVERMQDDSQLAEVLADAIACVMEKQDFRMAGSNAAFGSGAGTEVAAFAVSPALGGTLTGISAVLRKDERQSGRVSVGLMHDAGYDISQAPMAWWLLESKKPKPVTRIAMPDRAAYLYQILGEVWESAGEATGP